MSYSVKLLSQRLISIKIEIGTSSHTQGEESGIIVKPVQENKMHRALKKALLQVDAIRNKKLDIAFVITVDNLKKKIFQTDIIYIERQQTKSIIYSKAEEHKVYESITALSERLDHSFLRVSQSVIVNMNEISEIRDKKVFLKNGKDIYYHFPRG